MVQRAAACLALSILASSAAAADVLQGPDLLDPAPEAVVDNGCRVRKERTQWSFTWREIPGARRYHLQVWHAGARYRAVDRQVEDPRYESSEYSYVADQNRCDWRWRVRARVDGEWTAWGEERPFTVEPLDTDCGKTDPPDECGPMTMPLVRDPS